MFSIRNCFVLFMNYVVVWPILYCFLHCIALWFLLFFSVYDAHRVYDLDTYSDIRPYVGASRIEYSRAKHVHCSLLFF